eukprot:scaffold40941_cov50-Phaeocystis_antarctica.AAC.1
MKASSALSAFGRMPSSAWVAFAASRMPDSKRLRKYFELEASATRWALNSTPSAQTAKSVSRSSRQSPASEGWCGTPPCSVSLGAVAAAGCEGAEAVAAAAAVRARFLGAMLAKFGVATRFRGDEAAESVAWDELLALELGACRGRGVVGLEPLLDGAALSGMMWPAFGGLSRGRGCAHRANGIDHDLGRDRTD